MAKLKQRTVIPSPKEMNLREENIDISKDWGIIADKEKLRKSAEIFCKEFSLSSKGEKKNFYLKEENLPEDGYQIEIKRNRVNISAASEKGFFYALQTLNQLKYTNTLPLGEINDYPSLKIRGFQIMLESMRQIGFEQAVNLIKTAAKFKLNTILLEYGDRFPYTKHSIISAADALSKEEIRILLKTAQECHIEIIPLLQSLGHLNYVLKWNQYASLREYDADPQQFCANNPDSFKLYTELAEEIIEFHPGGKFFHIGADEARQLGICPKCNEQVEKIGKGELYIEHINKVCRWIKGQGRIPILWDDMLCANPEALDKLDKEAWIMYWDYWTTSEKSSYVIVRYDREKLKGKDALIFDSRWENEWKIELGDLQAKIMKHFGSGVNPEQDLGQRYQKVYGKYLGKDFPKYFH